VLQYLQKYNVEGVERCIASSLYEPPEDKEKGSVATSPSLIEDSDFFPQKSLITNAAPGRSSTPSPGRMSSTDDEGAPKKATSFLVSLYEEDEEESRKNDQQKKGSENQRVMIVLDPFFQSAQPSKSTLQDITEPAVKVKAVHNLITTMVEMLSAGAAGSDLQPLMDVDTGK
jgi:hypothetical protein